MFEDVSPRRAAAVGLVALVPTIVYGIGRPGLSGFVAAVNVVLIFAALYVALSPVDDHARSENETPT
ncbi:cytochrome-ba3 oxidase subunit [Natrarchaeobius oligotrophus]|uniref:Cytochrome-ba3 oxidase subunit n=1 Tax=Natrarchaeobius chitinivorans TaxID=1679083 RepID=A0A3N6MLX2_NATCH|nr:cytochrome-ba3 oxidase subunit [Natrarchaeobius chitinivorans]RQH02505.1 cytochrome-ba3 oxidase subunit [Natrarchaeobius chitinivorans]